MIDADRLRIRPVILAGGRGTRLRPRTFQIPKPMLPIHGRPILWYVLRNARTSGLLPPIVTLDYKAELIKAYFDGSDAEFRVLPGRSMAEAFLETAEADDADAFLGMSSDVLFPAAGVEKVVGIFREQCMDTALFVRLPVPGYKKWRFVVESERLIDIRVEQSESAFERLLLVLKHDSVRRLRELLGARIQQESLPEHLRPFQSGWTLLLKCLAVGETPVFSQIADVPVHNINAAEDLVAAESFVAKYFREAN